MQNIPRRSEHVSGRYFTLAPSELADRVRQLTNTGNWSEQSIGARGERLCEIVLQTKTLLLVTTCCGR